MKLLSYVVFYSTLAVLLIMSGCELVTDGPLEGRRPCKSSDLVINEVFTISPDKYYAYSWLELFNPTDHYIRWFDELFPATYYAVGTNGAFIYTDDDGDRWKVVSSGTPVANFNAIDFPYPDTGYAVGDNGLVRKFGRDVTGALAASDVFISPPVNLHGVSFGPISSIGFVCGDGGIIRRTIDRGVNWTAQTSTTTHRLNSLVFIEFPTKMYAVGDTGTILRKSGGISWVKQNVPLSFTTSNFYAVSFGTDTGFVVGENGKILFSSNGGTLWNAETCFVSPTSTVPLTTTYRSVYFSDNRGFAQLGRAWAAGDNGTIIRTDDYGKHWEVQSSGTTARLNKIVFSDSMKGCAYGENGTLLQTKDGGHNWLIKDSKTAETLVDAKLLPLGIKVQSRYVLQILAKRKAFFFDPFTGTINFDFYTKIDTGLFLFDPLILAQQGVGAVPKPVAPNSFVVLNSDSVRFKDHTKLGPGTTTVMNVSIGYYTDTTTAFGAVPVKWDLLSAGEIRLVKFKIKQTVGGQPIFLGVDQTTVEVVRYGDFVPTTAIFPSSEIYPNNIPVGFIPEGYSLARFANDCGGIDPDKQNTKGSFYMAKDPIPGWFSQESK